ncbi:MAG: hypothetical protein ABH878_06080, partial [bacterium]
MSRVDRSQEREDLQQFKQLEVNYLAKTADDKPLVAYLCLRVPVETIEACGAIPLRIAPLNHTAEATFSPVRTDG